MTDLDPTFQLWRDYFQCGLIHICCSWDFYFILCHISTWRCFIFLLSPCRSGDEPLWASWTMKLTVQSSSASCFRLNSVGWEKKYCLDTFAAAHVWTLCYRAAWLHGLDINQEEKIEKCLKKLSGGCFPQHLMWTVKRNRASERCLQIICQIWPNVQHSMDGVKPICPHIESTSFVHWRRAQSSLW